MTLHSTLHKSRSAAHSAFPLSTNLGLAPPRHRHSQTAVLFFLRQVSLGQLVWMQKVPAFFVGMENSEMICPSVSRLHSRAQSLDGQFSREGGRHLIDEAIALGREALELCPPDHSLRAKFLTALSIYLSDRYGQFGDMKDIEEGITLDRKSLELRPRGHSDRHINLGNLGVRLATRYRQLGKTDDLDEAIALQRESILCPQGHRGQSISLNNLGNSLQDRYKKLGAIEDLDESISFHRYSLAGFPPEDCLRSSALNNLSRGLHSRYLKLGTTEDLEEAIVLKRQAVDLCPPGHCFRPLSLTGLSGELHDRYQKFGKIEDLHEAIVLNRDAARLCPPGNPLRSSTLSNLARDLHARYWKLGAVNDLHEAIECSRDALDLCPPGREHRPMWLNNRAIYLYALYKELRNIDDLDESIVLAREALGLCLPGHSSRSHSLQNLAVYLQARFTCSCRPQDMENLFILYAKLVDISHTASLADLSAAQTWINVAEDFKHPTTIFAYETYLRLLDHHLVTLPSLPRHLNLVKDLTSSLALDAFSAALRNQSPTKAVEFLEQGRGVFLSQLGRLRFPVDDVIASGPDGKTLGERFTELTSLIRQTLESADTNQHDRVFHLNVELQTLVSKIRGLPGFAKFLQPPLLPHLQKAAVDGPVVIVNASKYGCDALVVFFDRDPVHIPLRITRDDVRGMTIELHKLTKQTKIRDMGKYFVVIMRELWEVVSPVVDVLKANHPVQSRIWWCPTAEFSVLPLHAAGMYRTGQPKLSDFYISSYTSSLTALILARQHGSPNFLSEGKRFVGIGQAKAAGESELHSISDELTKIGERVEGHAVFTRMEGTASSIVPVVEALGKNEWVHLACHGLPSREQPFESAFGLYDGRLTVERLLHCDLRSAEFAYLSACHTTVGDEDCLDEMIHLASAMQFAGFRSVIGTMWAVDDKQTVKITSKFYEKMVDESGRLDYTRAAYALHETMRELQGLSFDQRILYVHFGV